MEVEQNGGHQGCGGEGQPLSLHREGMKKALYGYNIRRFHNLRIQRPPNKQGRCFDAHLQVGSRIGDGDN